MNYPKRKMKLPFFVLQALIFCNCFIGSYLQTQLVWVSSFETDESDFWNVTSGNSQFQRVLYSSMSTPPKVDYWLISAQGVNKELMPPPVVYYGGKITVKFLAYVLQPSTLTVRFLSESYEEVQASSISVASNGWNSYPVTINNFQYPSFLVSFKYSSDIQIYLDAITITIDGSIISCPSIYSTNRCGFSLDVPSNYGWSFSGTKVDWITISAFTYLKRDFLYLGGLLKGSMNFKAVQNGVSATIQISINQTSYRGQLNSGYTDFDLTASTQSDKLTVGQTYTILITFITTSIKAQLSSLSMKVAGDMALCNCHAVLTCSKLTNGVTCACIANSCPGLNKQCIVSKFNQSANPCSCLPGYTEDSSGNCVDIDECASSALNNCSNNAICINNNGSYNCICKNSYKTINGENESHGNLCQEHHKTLLYNCTFESKENGSCNVTSNNPPFQKSPYSSISTLPQEGDYCAVAQGYLCKSNCELRQSEVQYNGGTIIIDFYAYVSQPSNLIVRLLMSNLNEVQSYSVSIKSNGWNLYSVSHDTFPDTYFLVSFIYSGNSPIYMDSVSTSIGDINECNSLTPPCSWSNGVCVNKNGSYTCICANGWIMGQDNASCVDINECTGLTPACSWRYGICTNTIGSYQCTCASGWIMGQNNASCVDINECKSLTPPCSWSNGVCVNTNGSYTCICANGWIMGQDNASCDDINECTGLTPPCSWSNGVCTNTNGSYQCTCASGWMMGQNNASCIDINECTGLTPPCSWSYGVCTNTNGSYQCTCANGWMMSQNNASCVDINECSGLTPACSWSNGVCTNTIGSYQCTCASGWMMGQNNASCVDINECTGLTPACSWSNGVCTNTNGSYQCTCASGWMMRQNNASCLDINECTGLTPACSWSNGVCTNTNGSYQCTCASGWMMDQNNSICVDINECISNLPPCPWRNGVCTNTNGSYFCSCLNEWMMGQDNASCVDKCNNTCIYSFTNETYTSSCNNGSSLNSIPTGCFDVSECISNNNCNWTNGVCTNAIGQFKCSCNGKWELNENGTNCIYPAKSFSVSNKGITFEYIPLSNLALIKIVVVFVCKLADVNAAVNLTNCYPVGELNPQSTQWFTIGSASSKLSRKKRAVKYDNPPLEEGAVYVVFYIGFTSDGQKFTSPLSEPIVTVDPRSPCGPKACFSYKHKACNVINSTYAKCHCKNGFISFDNGLTCEDIDECSSVANTCNFKNSLCTNLIGSSECSCIEGYKLVVTQDSCVDINECETSCKALNTTCNNTPGSYDCFCNVSGSYYNTTLNVCLDLNECSTSNQRCDPVRGICNNQNVFETGITYTCSCPIGFELSKDGSNSCLDIDECSTLCKGANALCTNTIGSFKCSCDVGFSLNSSSQCQLNNSCNCPLNSNCTMNGSFGCTCNPGYSKNFMSNCQASDQCLGTNNCMKSHQFCQNIFANLSYTCLCRSGYEKVGDECKAINVNVCNLSSMNNISLCPFDQQCYDTNSGFECRCQPGYEKNNLGYCQDVNECEENISACPSNAYCTNTNGSYYCQCNKGFIGENVSNSSMMHCYIPNNAWSSWEQIGTCSELCAKDEKQGKLKFQRFCEAANFSSCNDVLYKEEVCNSELCDNKIEILKSPDCEMWSNMQANVSDQSLRNNETWINKIRAWGGWKAKACGPSLNDVSKFVNQDIENIITEINRLLADKNALRKAIDCNAYIQRKKSLKTQYVTIYSRLAMYTAFETALNKLKSRIDMKLNECTRGLSAIYF